MHKNGDSMLEKQMIYAFYLILAVVIYFMVNNVVSEKSYFDDYLVREIGLTTDLSYNSPGRLGIEYSKLSDVSLQVKDNSIKLSPLTKESPKTYLFTLDKNYPEFDYNVNLVNNYNLTIIKEKNSISFGSIKNE